MLSGYNGMWSDYANVTPDLNCYKSVAGLRGHGASDTLAHGPTSVSERMSLKLLVLLTRDPEETVITDAGRPSHTFGHAAVALVNRGVS